MKRIRHSMLLVFMGLIASFQGNAATTVNGGNVSGKWTKADSPYHVNGNITVAAGSTLEIEPGVTVVLGSEAGLSVGGQLLAQGTPGDSIIFTGGAGLTFNAAEGEDESVVKYAVIKNGSKSQSGGGVYIGNGKVTLTNSTISDNAASSAGSYSYGGGIYIANGAVTLTDNTISNNTAAATASNTPYSYGGGIYVSNTVAKIYNNVISNNKHAASKTGDGGGIFLYNSNSIIVNNTIAYNDAENGGGVYCSNGSSPVVINNIIYGNSSSLESQVFIADNNSAPKMLYNLNQCDCWGHAAGVNYNWEANYDASNFDAVPQFVNYALQNYRLQSTSPCINAGIKDVAGLDLPNVDMDGNTRIYGGRIDIGAYEYGAPQGSGIENTAARQSPPVAIYPNPSPDGMFQLKTDCNTFSWTVFDMTGKAVLQGDTPQIDLRAHEKGVYVIKVSTEKAGYRMKLIKL